jgi:isopentenyl-diphosphate delta-isomerase
VSRELSLVELVDASGRAVGAATVADAHEAPGWLHRAFSVLLVDDEGRTLLQQRAAAKTRFPLRWANSCCGHPAPGESVTSAASRRLGEELGVRDVALTEVGVYTYHADDPATGRVEKEYDHVVIGHVPGDLELDHDPAEVAALRWVPLTLSGQGRDYAPWLHGVLNIASASAFLRRS